MSTREIEPIYGLRDLIERLSAAQVEVPAEPEDLDPASPTLDRSGHALATVRQARREEASTVTPRVPRRAEFNTR